MNTCDSRIAVAATPMADPDGRQVSAEVAGGELAAIVGAEGEFAGRNAAGQAAASTQAIASSSRQRSSNDQPTGSPVQQSIIACR
jgi:hypothetical protein